MLNACGSNLSSIENSIGGILQTKGGTSAEAAQNMFKELTGNQDLLNSVQQMFSSDDGIDSVLKNISNVFKGTGEGSEHLTEILQSIDTGDIKEEMKDFDMGDFMKSVKDMDPFKSGDLDIGNLMNQLTGQEFTDSFNIEHLMKRFCN